MAPRMARFVEIMETEAATIVAASVSLLRCRRRCGRTDRFDQKQFSPKVTFATA